MRLALTEWCAAGRICAWDGDRGRGDPQEEEVLTSKVFARCFTLNYNYLFAPTLSKRQENRETNSLKARNESIHQSNVVRSAFVRGTRHNDGAAENKH